MFWTGTHNIQETKSSDCSSELLGSPLNVRSSDPEQYLNSGDSFTFTNDELTALPGTRRYFKCQEHCAETAARIEVYCPATSTESESETEWEEQTCLWRILRGGKSRQRYGGGYDRYFSYACSNVLAGSFASHDKNGGGLRETVRERVRLRVLSLSRALPSHVRRTVRA